MKESGCVGCKCPYCGDEAITPKSKFSNYSICKCPPPVFCNTCGKKARVRTEINILFMILAIIVYAVVDSYADETPSLIYLFAMLFVTSIICVVWIPLAKNDY